MKTMKMPPDIKQRWIDALRSGQYPQGHGRLQVAGRFCCLGVLCEVLGIPAVTIDQRICYGGCETGLPREAVQRTGLYNSTRVKIDGQSCPLPYHNDTGATFEQIAQAIETDL